MVKNARRDIITTSNIEAKRLELEAMQIAYEKQEFEKVVRATRAAGVDIGQFTEAEVAAVFRKLSPSFSEPVAAGVTAGTRQTRRATAQREKAHADGERPQGGHADEDQPGRPDREG